MNEFKQWEMNRELMFLIWESLDKETYREIMYVIWESLDVGTYREMTKLLRSALSTGEYTCLGCGSVLSPKLLDVAFDEKPVNLEGAFVVYISSGNINELINP